MTINKFMRGQLEKRDPYCVHCGETTDLVIHHRKNRGMGGSKVLVPQTRVLGGLFGANL